MRMLLYGAIILKEGWEPAPGDKFDLTTLPRINTPKLTQKGLTLLHGFYDGHGGLNLLRDQMEAKGKWIYPVEVQLSGNYDKGNSTDFDNVLTFDILHFDRFRKDLYNELEARYETWLRNRKIPLKKRPEGLSRSYRRFSWQPQYIGEFVKSTNLLKHATCVIYPVRCDDGSTLTFGTVLNRSGIMSATVRFFDSVTVKPKLGKGAV